jgi:hypothetical protein
MNNKEFNLKFLIEFRKTLLTQYVFIENAKKQTYLPGLVKSLNEVSKKMYSLLYEFLTNACILNLFQTTYYLENQTNIANFLEQEMLLDFKKIKLFLITVIDCGACRLSSSARKKIFSKNYISEYSHVHITTLLNQIKQDITFFVEDLEKNTYEKSVICINNFLECYNFLENAVTLEQKIVAVSKVLNVWHCNGPFFYKNYSENKDYNNPTAPFTKQQFDKLSNIPLLEIENKIKKLS